MKNLSIRLGLLMAGLLALAVVNVHPATAKPVSQDDQVARGKYLTTIAGCVDCHTPHDPKTFEPIADKAFAGGYVFPLGPAGTVYTKNLTPDKETGLGNWTDQEIKTAISTGVDKDGHKLFNVMPYLYFSKMSDEDLDAIVAYLRTLKPIKNAVPPRELNIPEEALPTVTHDPNIKAPDPSDTANRAQYLMTAVIACSDCHTPLDPQTGAPIMEKYFAGGQPYEGPWGIVYGGNITPDKETGIGNWTDADIKRVLQTGVRPDGRRVVVMPWQLFTALSDEDANAVLYYLRNDVKAVSNQVPAADLKPEFVQMVEIKPETPPGPDPVVVGGIAVAALVLVGGALYLMRRRGSSSAQ